ncbi:stage II sporulation protein GA (sporulation sigma-E factor processing peptidase) [Proteiniborus sp. DW1]|uniref:sigma-E processing peptidase SpoIIGA n=1 Tax=Proteiniborus sp. DW1 TaxID=1889883 RepID=UPI00092DF90A|nr:sigma-E processing peptidase SpoIIGA [Proteiniborus sp. DW1]SCG83217.1 stage II sporulation protein GA (sporulation sigma-E factor processing peptidase) [Proteiniborus sp. DW1]
MYIYAEYLLLENMVINYILLYLTGKFTKTEANNVRLLLASFIGAAYALVIFFPLLMFMTKFIIKLAVSILIIIVAFNPMKIKKFIRLISTFYVMAFIFAGASLALFYLADIEAYAGNGIFYIKDFPVKILVLAVSISYVLIKIVWGYIQSILTKSKIYIPIIVSLNNKAVEIMGLLDTGNLLRDPLTQTPVIIIQFSAIKELLPSEVQSIFEKYKENDLQVISEIMMDNATGLKFRLIPFKSLGKENGMLIGFKPDNVVVKDDEDKSFCDIIVGIYNNNLSNDEKYVALLHPEMFTQKEVI